MPQILIKDRLKIISDCQKTYSVFCVLLRKSELYVLQLLENDAKVDKYLITKALKTNFAAKS